MKLPRLLIIAFFIGVFVLPLIPLPVAAMTGSGTVGDPYKIYTVTDLQNMNLDLDAYYELADDIDASATSGWNGGEGFEPIGDYSPTDSPHYPTSDLSSSGSWTIYPADGVFFNKTNNNDADTTYVQATADSSSFLCGFSGYSISDQATEIDVTITIKAKAIASGTNAVQAYFQMGGSNYTLGSSYSYSTSYYDKYWSYVETNPATGLPWTPSDINSITAIGAYVSDADPNVRITYVRIWINYNLIFQGSFDGKGHTISDLYINRPTRDEVGLFGYADYGAVIKDVTLEDVTITGDGDVGALVGMVYSQTIPLASSISGCSIVGGSVVSSGYDSGGLVGYAMDTVIEDCYTTCDITPEDYGGGLIGTSYSCEISNCYAAGDVIGDAVYSNCIGGFVGEEFGGSTYEDCYAIGNVSGYQFIGGFLGEAWGDNTIFDDCYSTGDVYGRYDVGGFIGGGGGDNLLVTECYAEGDVYCNQATGWALGGFTAELYGTNITVTLCYALGDVDGNDSDDVGGFIGYKDNSNNITKCFSLGNVLGTTYVGGFCGEQYDSVTYDCYSRGTVTGVDKIGGFSGYNDGGIFINSYSTGSASGSNNTGGFCGLNDAGNVTDCFWDSEASGNPTSSGGTGLTTAEMKTESTFTDAGWDFSIEPIWNINEVCNDGYPYICQFCYLPIICNSECDDEGEPILSPVVPDNNSTWVISASYFNYFKEYVDGNLTLWYQPVTMINSPLPDRSGNGLDGDINWGMSIGYISVGGILPYSAYTPSGTETVPVVLPGTGDIPTDPTGGATGEGLPLYYSFRNAAQSLGWSIPNTYLIMFVIIAIVVGVAAMAALRSIWGFTIGFGATMAMFGQVRDVGGHMIVPIFILVLTLLVAIFLPYVFKYT